MKEFEEGVMVLGHLRRKNFPSNESYAPAGNQHCRVKEFEEGDMVLVHLRWKKFPSNESYASAGNQHHRVKEFEEGDMVLVHLRRKKFPKGTYHKLKSKKFGPCKALKKISSNAYVVELASELYINLIFNVSDLYAFEGFIVDKFQQRYKFNNFLKHQLMLLKMY